MIYIVGKFFTCQLLMIIVEYKAIIYQYKCTKVKIMSINVIHLVGRAGRDPDIKYFEDTGKAKCTLTIAVNRMKKDDGPDWFDLEIWDKTAKIAADYVKKGSLIGITGELKFDYWSDKNTGDPRSKPIIRVTKLDLLGSKRDNEANRDFEM